ncbi:Hpt domain-containing protein [Aeromonas diversa]|uniref:Phosphorelay protein LuxU n=1 Tax=Aeromonas diversa CDC 2478-85 TaxID=1268237 RepID=N9U318_9GAMM|nr:Hpt domain-containing protein [Aeromonas diversa]ENY72769.1 phosphorelay protein LuxU [Aeromonas diversa CDC 2478-85]
MELLNRGTLQQLERDIGSDMLPVVIRVFLDEVGQQRNQLGPLLAAEEVVALGRLAHSIKSSCGSYGAELSQQQAAQIELRCRNGEPAAALKGDVTALEHSLAEVLAQLSEMAA